MTLRKFEKTKPAKAETAIDQLILEQYRLDILELGAAGQLLVSCELKEVLPAEDSKLLDAANPIRADGKVKIDKAANERREDAMLRTMLKGGKISVIILGGAHDLADNGKRHFKGECRYVRVVTKKYWQTTLEEP